MNNRAVEQNRETSIRLRTLVILVIAAVIVAPTAATAATAAARQRDTVDTVDVTVVEISGLLDRIQASFLHDQVTRPQRGTDLVVVRLDSRGSVIAHSDLAALVGAIRRAPTPTAIWLGPSNGAQAAGDTAELLTAADVVGVAPGADRPRTRAPDVIAPTLGDFIVALDGRHGIDMPTKVADPKAKTPHRQLAANVRVSFAEPSFVEQLLHAVSTPGAAYLLLVAGLLLLVFEFFTGGIGVAGGVAALCVVLGGYGLGALPTRPLGLALVVAGVLGYAVDVQVGVPRAWTVIGTVLFTAGSLLLFAGGLHVPLAVLAAVLAAAVLFMVAGMPAVVRARFSTPTIGRQSMIGELGTATTDVAPDGLVSVRDAPWRARTNRATPIRAGEAVRVAAIDGLLLEVEPLEGAARDAGH
jgi:membrane-bound serine protease (ClpP class)